MPDDNSPATGGHSSAPWQEVDREVDPDLAEKRDMRGTGSLSQTTAEMDAGTLEHTYQTADGTEVTEEISASNATMVPSYGNTPVVTPPGEGQERAA